MLTNSVSGLSLAVSPPSADARPLDRSGPALWHARGETCALEGAGTAGGDTMVHDRMLWNRHRKNIFFVPIYLSFTSGSDFLPIWRFCKGLKW
jgi:hypothetical protein